MCICSLHQLPRIHTIFEAFSQATALLLKAAKCILIPFRTGTWTDEERNATYAAALRRIVPAWADLDIRSHCAYLGHDTGPDAMLRTQWAAPQGKYTETVNTFAAATTEPSMTLQCQDTYCAPALLYTAQPPPPTPHSDEQRVRLSNARCGSRTERSQTMR